jgi:hypothetical protein
VTGFEKTKGENNRLPLNADHNHFDSSSHPREERELKGLPVNARLIVVRESWESHKRAVECEVVGSCDANKGQSEWSPEEQSPSYRTTLDGWDQEAMGPTNDRRDYGAKPTLLDDGELTLHEIDREKGHDHGSTDRGASRGHEGHPLGKYNGGNYECSWGARKPLHTEGQSVPKTSIENKRLGGGQGQEYQGFCIDRQGWNTPFRTKIDDGIDANPEGQRVTAYSEIKAALVLAMHSSQPEAAVGMAAPSLELKAALILAAPSSELKAALILAAPSSGLKAALIMAAPSSEPKAALVMAAPSLESRDTLIPAALQDLIDYTVKPEAIDVCTMYPGPQPKLGACVDPRMEAVQGEEETRKQGQLMQYWLAGWREQEASNGAAMIIQEGMYCTVTSSA